MNISSVKWKYLRETNNKYYNPNRHTTLKEYLECIFPNDKFIYDTNLTKDLIVARNRCADYRRYRPDARCEELNLIVEFDGTSHYQDQKVVLTDIERDKYLKSLGYKVVRIPYWIQLSHDVINFLFGVDVDDEMCQLPYSFYNPDNCDSRIEICPGSMSEAGRDRFVKEFNEFPDNIKLQILHDLEMCIAHLPSDVPPKYVLPDDVKSRLYDYT